MTVYELYFKYQTAASLNCSSLLFFCNPITILLISFVLQIKETLKEFAYFKDIKSG